MTTQSGSLGGVATVRREGLADALGREIVAGEIGPGSILRLEELQVRFGVSRTVARDSVKVLESLGLLYSKRRIGLVVTEPEHWNVYAPAVIGWRLAAPGAQQAYVELTQLRIAVEPEAAALAAQMRSAVQAERISELAQSMRRLGEAGRLEEFMVDDVAFHRELLNASQNSMFSALGDVVAEVLTGRTTHGLMPERPRPEALDAHDAVARAVLTQDAAEARRHMQYLVDEVRAALRE